MEPVANFSGVPHGESGPNLGYLSHRSIIIDDWPAAASRGRANGFASYRFGRADTVNLPRIVGREFKVRAELLPIIECLSRHAATDFRNVSEMYASVRADVPSERAIRILRNFFLDAVDRSLQDLYRRHFASQPQTSQIRHDQKIASLESVGAKAREIVGAYDWQWLADWLELDRIGENAASCVARLSNLAFEVTQVNFRFTYHCNIACRHCYNGSGPHLKAQHIPLEPMLAIVAQMPGAGIGHLKLTGGEPFLYQDQLVALIAAGRAAGLRGISIFTNGYWATTHDAAKRTLERLTAAGFMAARDDFLKVSTGLYHQEFIAFDRVLTLARCYNAMFGRRLQVDVELTPGGREMEKQVYNQVSEAGLSEQVQLGFRHVTPLGRGKELHGTVTGPIENACSAINQIVFDPDGSSRPCCGLNNENQGVIVGDLTTDRLVDLVKRMQNDPILQFLAGNPMSTIFEHLDKSANPVGYTDACHLCQNALGDMGNKEPLQSRLFGAQRFYPFWFRRGDGAEMAPLTTDMSSSEGLD